MDVELRPPPERESYPSLDALISAINAHAAGEGYAVVRFRTRYSKKNELRKVWLRCDKGGKYEAKGSGKRDTSTRQTECPFELIALRDLETSQWACVVKDSDHNH